MQNTLWGLSASAELLLDLFPQDSSEVVVVKTSLGWSLQARCFTAMYLLTL